ncbi:MAG: hypothetical protein ABSF64_39920 [Bryobacteraceae bacterium]
MRRVYNSVCAIVMTACCTAVALAQPAAKTTTAVPRLVNFSGTLTDGAGKAQSGVVGVTLALYEEQEGGAPVWMETQNVQADSRGKYTALLGATKNEGIPAEIFGAGQRWLGVQAQGEPECPRVLMTSVPYSLKAVDSETLGGLPASAFALAGTSTGEAGRGAGAGSIAAASSGRTVEPFGAVKPAATPAAVTGTGTTGSVPLWTSSTALGTSNMLQNSSTGNIGINTPTPVAELEVDTSGMLAVFGRNSASASGNGVIGEITGSSGAGVEGLSIAQSGLSYGVEGSSNSTEGVGVQGLANASSGTTYGVYGANASSRGAGVFGKAKGTTGSTYGVYGLDASNEGGGLYGENNSASGTTYGVYAIDFSTEGYGLKAISYAETGTTYGVYGLDGSSAGIGVEGSAVATTGENFGVYGITASNVGTGVKGVGVAVSAEGANAPEGAAGLWGDTSTGAEAILATADNTEAIGAYSKSNSQATVYAENASTEADAIVLATFGPEFTGYCDTFTNGNLMCSGSVGGHAVVNQSRDVALYSVQAAENWMEDAGSGQLKDGIVVIQLEPDFAQTVNTGIDYHVFLTPNGKCMGLYVSQKSPTSFEVRELGDGKASIAFDYRIMARRKGFENIRLADMTGKVQPVSQRKKARVAAQEPGRSAPPLPLALTAARPNPPARTAGADAPPAK